MAETVNPLVVISDSILGKVQFHGAVSAHYFKRSHNDEDPELYKSLTQYVRHHHFYLARDNVRQIGISGWRFSDAVPPAVITLMQEWFNREDRITFLISGGVNDLRLVGLAYGLHQFVY
jgi:hypothetical protein